MTPGWIFFEGSRFNAEETVSAMVEKKTKKKIKKIQNEIQQLEELFKKMELRPCQGDADLSQKEQDLELLKAKINKKKLERDQYKYSL